VDFINRLVFNIGIANNDMHLKNWSVIYRDGRTPALAPAYDYVCTKAYLGHSETGLALGSARYFSQVTIEQFERMAQRATVSTRLVRRTALAMVDRMQEEWPAVKERVPPSAAAVIDEQFRRVPLFSGSHQTPVEAPPAPSPQHDEVS
jgi:serine/threonine-protein kinase HipA